MMSLQYTTLKYLGIGSFRLVFIKFPISWSPTLGCPNVYTPNSLSSNGFFWCRSSIAGNKMASAPPRLCPVTTNLASLCSSRSFSSLSRMA
eukprot:Gb_19038 [translate_table: standard]